MDIYYENGCFRLWSIEALYNLPRTSVKKIAKMIGRNQHRAENAECLSAFCEWLCSIIEYYKSRVLKDQRDQTAAKLLKYYISVAEVL